MNEAIAIFNSLIEGNPDDPLYITGKAHCLLEMSRYQDALELYGKAMGIWRNGGTFQDGVALSNMRMSREAMEMLKGG